MHHRHVVKGVGIDRHRAEWLVLVVMAIAGATALYQWAGVTNATTIALTFLTIVLVVAATLPLWMAVVASVACMFTLNYFFLPPIGTLTITDPQNWVALFVFLVVSLVASNLSSTVRKREQEALDRRDEMARLFDLGRDILLMSGGQEALTALARVLARRFELDYVAICLPENNAWTIAESGRLSRPLQPLELSTVFAGVTKTLEFDASARAYTGHASLDVDGRAVHMVPLRAGTATVGLLAAAGRPMEPGTLDALGGLAAIAIERTQFLEERKTAELARQSEELKSALLASLAHDLRTPLTAIRLAATNLQATWLTPEGRSEQTGIVLTEVERLTRLFQNVLDMARIDAGPVPVETRWVHPSELVEAARDLVSQTLRDHLLQVHSLADLLVQVDPRLTSAALSHLLENAAQYSPAGSTIDVFADVRDGRLVLSVKDHGPGVAASEQPRLFERFYRGQSGGRRAGGSGMGLSIARGLLAAEHGQVWADNDPAGGAVFTISIPARSRSAATLASES